MKHSDLPTPAQVVDRLKEAYGVTSDSQLARHIGVAQTTVSTWKNKGPVPYEACVLAASQGRATLNELIFGLDRGSLEDARPIMSEFFKVGVYEALREFNVNPEDCDALVSKISLMGTARVWESGILMNEKNLSADEVLEFFKRRSAEMYPVAADASEV